MCTEKLDNWFSLQHRTKTLEPMIGAKNGKWPISRETRSGVSVVTDLWRKGFAEKVGFKFRVKE